MGKKLGALIKQARTGAGFTQEQLARKVKGVSAQDISAFERGVSEPTQQNCKGIAKVTGVTQKSLLDAMPKSGKTSGSSTTQKTTTSSSSTAKKSSMQVSATERRLVELYREADSATKKEALKVLRGTDDDDLLESIGNLLTGGNSKKKDESIDMADIVQGFGEMLFKK